MFTGNRPVVVYNIKPSLNTSKRLFGHVCSIRAVWSESSLGAFWIAKDATSLHTDKENSDVYCTVDRLFKQFSVHTPEFRLSGLASGLEGARETCRDGWIQDVFWWFRFDQIAVLLYVFGKTSLSKQRRPRSDAAICGIWSRSTLFATHPVILYTFIGRQMDLLAHLCTKCSVSYCDHSMSVVRRPSCVFNNLP